MGRHCRITSCNGPDIIHQNIALYTHTHTHIVGFCNVFVENDQPSQTWLVTNL